MPIRNCGGFFIGMAWRGWAGHGGARHGRAGQAGRGTARQGKAGQGTAWLGEARAQMRTEKKKKGKYYGKNKRDDDRVKTD